VKHSVVVLLSRLRGGAASATPTLADRVFLVMTVLLFKTNLSAMQRMVNLVKVKVVVRLQSVTHAEMTAGAAQVQQMRFSMTDM
jgi:hypothetical protein